MLRRKKGFSQQELADKANISRTYLSQIESGGCNPTIELLENIGKELCVPFPIISFLSLDIKSIPESRREDYLKIEPTIMRMIEEFLFTETECQSK
jgi:transcriptional regulator with XRE-family HTH domain